MKRFSFACALLAVLLPFGAAAQESPPPPPANPLQYNDPAMHYEAPSGYTLVGQHPLALNELSNDPQIVAGWALNLNGQLVKLLIQQEAYNGPLSGFDSVYGQQLRNDFDDALVKNREHTSLKNGMPAIFIEISSGSGFTSEKTFGYEWIDGQRGVVIMISAPLGAINESQARQILSTASAVQYPIGRE